MMGIENEKPHTGFNRRVNVIMADSDTTLLDIGVMISAKWMLKGIKHGFYSLDFTGGTVAEHFGQFPVPQPCQSMCEICESVFTQDELCNAIEVGFEKRKWQGVIIDYIQIVTRDEGIPGRLAEIAKKYDKPIVCLSMIPSPSKQQR